MWGSRMGEKNVRTNNGGRREDIFRLVARRKGRVFVFIFTGWEFETWHFSHVKVQETNRRRQTASSSTEYTYFSVDLLFLQQGCKCGTALQLALSLNSAAAPCCDFNRGGWPFYQQGRDCLAKGRDLIFSRRLFKIAARKREHGIRSAVSTGLTTAEGPAWCKFPFAGVF